MKRLVVGLLVLAAISVSAEIPYVGDLPSFRVNNPIILWDAPTNLGASLWVYKVAPQVFPIKAINRLLKLGGFTNRITTLQALSLANSSNTCNIIVKPELGYVRYWDEFATASHWDRTNHLWEVVKGLPSQSDTLKLGLKILKQWGVTRDDLAQKENGHLITFGENKTRSYYDRRSGKQIENEITTRGIFFTRRIDGVNFLGIGVRGGSEIEFGNNAEISQFTLIWRNYQPYERYRVASPNEIEQYILDNKTFLTHKNIVSPSDVKALTINEVAFVYAGANELEKQDYLSPFAKIEATADMGTNNVGIELYCPILSTNLVR